MYFAIDCYVIAICIGNNTVNLVYAWIGHQLSAGTVVRVKGKTHQSNSQVSNVLTIPFYFN